MTITCATYNILHGYHRDMILKNIRFLINEGADVICLQEAELRFEPLLKKLLAQKSLVGWQMRSAHIGLGGNVTILWNSAKLRLTRTRVVHLPKLRKPSKIQRLRGRLERTDRAAIVGTFEAHGIKFQITSAHIDWEGGSGHRMRQIDFLRGALEKEKADVRIIAGDFNTIAPRPLKRMHERRVEKILGPDYINAFPKLAWSHDISHADPSDGFGFLPKLHRAGLRLRRRLDYIFATNVSVVSGVMHDLPGSDHRPLIATLRPVLLPRKKVLS